MSLPPSLRLTPRTLSIFLPPLSHPLSHPLPSPLPPSSHQFLAVEAHGWFLARVYKESVRDLRTRFEGAVDPERPPTPHLLRRSPSDGVSHTLSCPQSRAVIGDLVGTFLVEILITSCEEEGGRRREGVGGGGRRGKEGERREEEGGGGLVNDYTGMACVHVQIWELQDEYYPSGTQTGMYTRFTVSASWQIRCMQYTSVIL